MSVTAPVVGQDPWGDDLNAYLAFLEDRIEALEAKKEHIYNSYSWQYSNQAPPATGSQVRFNSPTLNLATVMDIRLLDNDTADRSPVFQILNAGDSIRINDWNNAAAIHRFTVAGPPSIGVTNVTIPVTWVSGQGVIPNAKVNIAFLVTIPN